MLLSSDETLETPRLVLLRQNSGNLRAFFDPSSETVNRYGIAGGVRDFWKEVPREYVDSLLDGSGDPWRYGYFLVLRSEGRVIGMCGFKGPPDASGVVELAYAISQEYWRQGLATEAAGRVTGHLLETVAVKTVRAHTLKDGLASIRVLEKCGFALVGEVEEPGDGLVLRWEKA